MKTTEADIQAELDRHGLGWVVTGAAFLGEADTAGWADIGHPSDPMVIIAYGSGEKLQFKWNPKDIEIEYDDFLTGNYDLSAISQHYDPEEWQRIITMCERIVRLITGEQVEQTLEEKVRKILEPLSAIADIEVEPDVVTFTAGFSKREIVSTGVIDHDAMSDSCRHEDFDIYDKEYAGAYRKVAALLTEQPEQTLEEAVRGIVSDTDLIVSYVHGNEVSLDSGMAQHYYVSANSVKTPGTTLTLDDYVISDGKYSAKFQAIAALLSTRSTKPSYSDLEQRVEELEKEVAELTEIKNTQYKSSVRYCEESQQRGLRIAELESQLQNAISPDDHEADLSKLREENDQLSLQVKKLTADKQSCFELLNDKDLKIKELESQEIGYTIRQKSWRISIEL